MHSLILFLCNSCFSLKHWLSCSPFQQLFLPQKRFLTTLVLVRHPFSVFPLPEHLPPTVSQLPVYLCVLLIKLHMSWGQWTWPSHSYCLLSNSTVPGTNRHLFDEWTRKQKQWEYIRMLINHIMNEEAEGSEWGGKKSQEKTYRKSQRIAWRKCQKEQSWKQMPQNENASFSSNKENWKECIYLMWQKIFLDTFAKEVLREWWG